MAKKMKKKALLWKVLGCLVMSAIVMSAVQSLFIFSASAVPIIPSPGVDTDKSSICCGDYITVNVPVKNLKSVSKTVSVYIVIKDPNGNTKASTVKTVTLSAHGSTTVTARLKISKPCNYFGTYTVKATVKEGSTVHDTDTTTFKVNDCESKPCKVWIEIIDKYCKGYRVYVDGNYQFTEGQSGTPDGYCRFDVTPGTHKFELCKDRCTVSKSWYCQCGTYYSWVSMNDMYPHWCDCNKKPDLIIQDISWSSSSPKQGDKITFTVKIKNQDSGSAGSSRVNYYIDGSSVGSDSVPALSAYRTSTQEFTWTANKCGTVQVKAVADAYNAVDPESNEGNNARTETVSITCTTPDLIIQDISWLPSSPKQGDTITFTVKIKNQDSGSAGSSRVNYYIDGSYVDYASVPALSAYRTSTQEFTWTANKCGTVQVKAVADAYNAVDPESNEGNNDRTGTINVICREKPAPEIVEVKYPPACVKEGEDATISVTVENKGGTSNEGYISVSFPNGEDVSVVSGTGNGYNKLYQKESVIWGKEGIIPSPIDPLVDLLDTNWVKYQQETITMNVKSNSGSDEIVFYVRAALKNADGSYERDPTYSGDKDQQGWYVERHVIDVCPKEACVIIDDDTCVGYEVYVDGASILTEGVGEILDGSCTFSATEGTHTIGIRDNECFAVIARNFQSDTTYRWDSMPKNWCKCNAEVKFRGVIVKESLQTLFYMYKIKIDKILMDPSDVLTSDGEIWIFSSGPATVDDVSIGDNVEGYGKYDGELNREVKLETAEHYLKNLGSQEEKKGRLTIEKIDLNTGCTPKDIKIPGSFGNFDLSDSVARQTRDRNPSVAKEGQIFYVTVKAKAHDSDLQKGQIYVVLVPPTEQTGVYCIERTQEPDKISKDELGLWKFKVTCLKGKIEVKNQDLMAHFWKIGVLTIEPNIFAFRAFAFTAFPSDQSELRSIPVISVKVVDFREEITESLKNELINKVTENLYSLLEIESYTVAALDTLNDAWNKAIENDKIFEEAKEDSRKTFLKVKLEDLYANQQPGSCT